VKVQSLAVSRLAELIDSYIETRQFTEKLVEPLSAEDCMIQSMEDASPTRWHLAHTNWFFEAFILAREKDYQIFDPSFHYLFNSYYNSLGKQFRRSQRGLLSRPSFDEIMEYRRTVDEHMLKRLESPEFADRCSALIFTGIHHEQQHQELILTDIKHALSCNPLAPAYHVKPFDKVELREKHQRTISAGNYDVGFAESGFSFDNERPRHRAYLHDCSLSNRLVTCGEYQEFIDDGGYRRPELWLSEGWSLAQQHSWEAPLYWSRRDGQWSQFTLAGKVPMDPSWPVCHVSLFEADAFARWSGKRLPTEFEWEVAAVLDQRGEGLKQKLAEEPFADFLLRNDLAFHPTRSPLSFFGGVWQWTSSSYQAYPGYRSPAGALGEYNGKFMCNQYVLRGGSVGTHHAHIRPTYRNFFPAHARWQLTGIRLAD
jgi:ergothioneine biosynthesis protein EgtB